MMTDAFGATTKVGKELVVLKTRRCVQASGKISGLPSFA